MTDIDPEVLVQERWNRYGPYSPEAIDSASAVLSELVRYLNYATGQGAAGALPYAGDAYRLLGNLTAAAGGQEQTYLQLATWSRELADDPALRIADHRNTPERARQAAAAAAESFTTAAALADQLRATLAAAHTQLGWLYHDLPDDPAGTDTDSADNL